MEMAADTAEASSLKRKASDGDPGVGAITATFPPAAADDDDEQAAKKCKLPGTDPDAATAAAQPNADAAAAAVADSSNSAEVAAASDNAEEETNGMNETEDDLPGDAVLTRELSTGTTPDLCHLASAGVYFRVRATRAATLSMKALSVSVGPSEDTRGSAAVTGSLYLLDGDWNESQMTSKAKWAEAVKFSTTTPDTPVRLEFEDGGLEVSPSKDRTFYLHCKGLIKLTPLFKSPRDYPSSRVLAMYPCGVSLTDIPFQNSFTRVPAVASHERKTLWYLPDGVLHYTGKKSDLIAPPPQQNLMMGGHGVGGFGMGMPYQQMGGGMYGGVQLSHHMDQMAVPQQQSLAMLQQQQQQQRALYAQQQAVYGQQGLFSTQLLQQQPMFGEPGLGGQGMPGFSEQTFRAPVAAVRQQQPVLTQQMQKIIEIVSSTGGSMIWPIHEIVTQYTTQTQQRASAKEFSADLGLLCNAVPPLLANIGNMMSEHQGWVHVDHKEQGWQLYEQRTGTQRPGPSDPQMRAQRSMAERERDLDSGEDLGLGVQRPQQQLSPTDRRNLMADIICATGDRKLWQKAAILKAYHDRVGEDLTDHVVLSDLKLLCDAAAPRVAMIGEFKSMHRGWISITYAYAGQALMAQAMQEWKGNAEKRDHRAGGGAKRGPMPHEIRRDLIFQIISATQGAKLWRKNEIFEACVAQRSDLSIQDNNLLADLKIMTDGGRIVMIGESKSTLRGWILREFADEGTSLFQNDPRVTAAAMRQASDTRQRGPRGGPKVPQAHERRRDMILEMITATGSDKLWHKVDIVNEYAMRTGNMVSDNQLLGDMKSLTECENPQIAMVGELRSPYKGYIGSVHLDAGMTMYISDTNTARPLAADTRKASRPKQVLAHEVRREVVYQIVASTGAEKLWRKPDILEAYKRETDEDMTDPQLLGDLKAMCENDNPKLVMFGEYKSPYRGWIAKEYTEIGTQIYMAEMEHRARNASDTGRSRSRNTGSSEPRPHEIRRNLIAMIVTGTGADKLWKKSEIMDEVKLRNSGATPSDTQLLGDLKALCECTPPRLKLIGELRSPHRGWMSFEHRDAGDTLYQQDKAKFGDGRRDRNKGPKQPLTHEIRRDIIYTIVHETGADKLWKKQDILNAYEKRRVAPDMITDTQLLGDLKFLTDDSDPKLHLAGDIRSPYRGWIGKEHDQEGEMKFVDEQELRNAARER